MCRVTRCLSLSLIISLVTKIALNLFANYDQIYCFEN